MSVLRACGCSVAAQAMVASDGVFFRRTETSAAKKFLLCSHSSSRRHALWEFEGLRGPATFETVLYMTLAGGDAGPADLPLLFCCVNVGREKRSRTPKKPAANRKNNQGCNRSPTAVLCLHRLKCKARRWFRYPLCCSCLGCSFLSSPYLIPLGRVFWATQ